MNRSIAVSLVLLVAVLYLLPTNLLSQNAPRFVPEIESQKEPLAEVIVEGNMTISSEEILKKVKTRPGHPLNATVIKQDVRTLVLSRWFFQVTPRLENSKSGPVLVFKVVERPVRQFGSGAD